MALITDGYAEGQGLRLPESESGAGWQVRVYSCTGRSTVGTPPFTRSLVHTYEASSGTLEWTYMRVGGCGKGTFVMSGGFADFTAASAAKWELDLIYVPPTGSEQVWYRGIIESVAQRTDGKAEILTFGYVSELTNLPLAEKTYRNQTTAMILTDLLDNHVVPERRITYDPANIIGAYTVAEVTFNQGVLKAIQTLADLEGLTEWGVLADRSFFFMPYSRGKAQGQNVYVIGGDVRRVSENFLNTTNLAAGANLVRVVGGSAGDGAPVESYALDTSRAAALGTRAFTLSVPEICAVDDATRLAANLLTLNSAGKVFYEGVVSLTDADGMPRRVEETVPVGEVTLVNDANMTTGLLAEVDYRLAAGSVSTLTGRFTLGDAVLTPTDMISRSFGEAQKQSISAKARPYARDDDARALAFFMGA